MSALLQVFQEGLFLPKPTLTETNLPDQTGRVHIITGGYAGCGFELCKILYEHNATIYVAGRSEDKAKKSIAAIKEAFPKSKGKVEFLKIDLSDFKTIKPAADEFLSKESSLHVLTNNAGVMMPPKGSKDVQGNELQLGTNCLGTYLFSILLLPLLQETAKNAPKDSVRVTWATSIACVFSPTNGVTFEENGEVQQFLANVQVEYAQSKVGNNFLAAEFARRYGKDGIISVAWNPGNLKTELTRHLPSYQSKFLELFFYPPVFGAYTELYAGWSPEITASNNGCYIAPWGRISTVRSDVEASLKTREEGGTGVATKFWEWCEKHTSQYK